MIYICKPARAEIFDNSGLRLSMAQVKARTGCDLVINGGYFGGGLEAYGNIRVDGEWIHREPWDIQGFVWDSGELPELGLTLDSGKDWVYSCLPVIAGGRPLPVNDNDREIGGRRGRSGWGVRRDGSFVFLCTADALGPMTVSEARDKLLGLGCVDAVLNDGGGSCQMSCPDGTVAGGRIISNFICVWFDTREDEPVERKYKVCLDPGHGTAEPNQSPDGRYLEYKMAWALANRIRENLEWTEAFDILLTKKTEGATPTLTARANTANGWGADVFVSVHSNAVGGSGWDDDIHGLTAWIYASGGKRQRLAELMLRRYEEAGVELFGSELYAARFAVLARTNMPAVLIEHLFHTCRSDVELLLSGEYLDKLAYAAACGICEYFNVGIDRLPEPESEAGVRADIFHTIQVGAFEDEDNARAMLELLRGKGVEGYMKTVSKSDTQ